MYGRSVADPDGHVCEIMWMDAAARGTGRRSRSRKLSERRSEGSGTMPMNPNSKIEITAFRWVPEGPRRRSSAIFAFAGRSKRPAWIIESAFSATERPPGLSEGPAVRPGSDPSQDGTIQLSRAALSFNISAKRARRFCPATAGSYRAIDWTYAAVNSVEPAPSTGCFSTALYAGEEWAEARCKATRIIRPVEA